MTASPYGYRYSDNRQILVHVVDEHGWQATPSGGISAMAMCGAGLEREARWPVAGQKWCRDCTDARHRYLNQTRIWPVGSC